MIDRTELADLYRQRDALTASARRILTRADEARRDYKAIEAHIDSLGGSRADTRTRLAVDDAERTYEAVRAELAQVDIDLGDLNAEIERRELALQKAAAPRAKAAVRASLDRIAKGLAEVECEQRNLNALIADIERTFISGHSSAGHVAFDALGNEPILAAAKAMKQALRTDREASPYAKFLKAMKACRF